VGDGFEAPGFELAEEERARLAEVGSLLAEPGFDALASAFEACAFTEECGEVLSVAEEVGAGLFAFDDDGAWFGWCASFGLRVVWGEE